VKNANCHKSLQGCPFKKIIANTGKEVKKLHMTKGRIKVTINEEAWSRGTQRMSKRSIV
jgi:hypothetical protein